LPADARFGALAFLAGDFTAGRLAADFLIDGVFAEDFFPALPPRLADAFFAEAVFERRVVDDFLPADFAPDDFRADFDPPARDADLPCLPVVPPDFPRDFLARVAMILLLGVGGENQHGE
jgi:hypothetical protein